MKYLEVKEEGDNTAEYTADFLKTVFCFSLNSHIARRVLIVLDFSLRLT